MFTKDGDQANNLHDMQCMWYEIECGRAHLRRQNYGKVGLRNTVSLACRILLACREDYHHICWGCLDRRISVHAAALLEVSLY